MAKSDAAFTSLFTDQTLEQEIKMLKRHGGIVGLSSRRLYIRYTYYNNTSTLSYCRAVSEQLPQNLNIEAAKSELRVPDLPPEGIADGAFRDWALVVDASYYLMIGVIFPHPLFVILIKQGSFSPTHFL